jgi:magnesium transporter
MPAEIDRAGRKTVEHRVVDALRVPVGSTAAEALRAAANAVTGRADGICVVDEAGSLVGVARLADLAAAEAERPVEDLVSPAVRSVTAETSQQEAAHAALRSGVAMVPVVRADGGLLGVVPAIDLLDILHEEHVEDLHRLAGIRREGRQARHAIMDPPARRARHRLPSLLIGLVGSVLGAAVVSRFEGLLESRLTVAYFIPGIVYLADAIGTQTEAIVVRALSFRVSSFRRMVGGEVRTGLWLGAVLGAAAWPLSLLAFGDVRLATAVAVSICAAGTLATAVGLLLPWSLWARGHDPALGSGPVATVVQDVLSLVLYFSVASLLLAP